MGLIDFTGLSSYTLNDCSLSLGIFRPSFITSSLMFSPIGLLKKKNYSTCIQDNANCLNILHVSNMSSITSTRTMLSKEGYIPNK